MDTKDWDNYAALFTVDATLVMESAVIGHPHQNANDFQLRGRDKIRRVMPSALETGETVHHVSMPEIEIMSPTAATGIWALNDIFRSREHDFHGAGYYHETYERIGEQWLISSLRLKWVYAKNVTYGLAGRLGPVSG